MPLVYVKADPQTEARARARLAAADAQHKLLAARHLAAEAGREYEVALSEAGPDPRLLEVDAAVGQFLATVTGRPSICDY